MSVRCTVSFFLALAALSLGLTVGSAGAESAAPSPESLRQHRVELFVKAGQQPLKQMADDVFRFATESERCRVSYGSKACGLPSDSLKSGSAEEVFDYYVRQPVGSVVDQQKPSMQRQDWDWNPNSGKSPRDNR